MTDVARGTMLDKELSRHGKSVDCHGNLNVRSFFPAIDLLTLRLFRRRGGRRKFACLLTFHGEPPFQGEATKVPWIIGVSGGTCTEIVHRKDDDNGRMGMWLYASLSSRNLKKRFAGVSSRRTIGSQGENPCLELAFRCAC